MCKILTFQSVICPFKCAILFIYFIYPEKIIFQTNVGKVTEKSDVVFKEMAIQNFTKIFGLIQAFTFDFTQCIKCLVDQDQ